MKLTDEAQAELKALETRAGKLTPQQVVEAASDESSALHGCFTWDDTEAAAKWRIEEARELIRSVKIEVVIEDRTIRTVGYVRDQTLKDSEAGYVATMKVRRQEAAEVMAAEVAAIGGMVNRAIGIAKAKGLGAIAERLEAVKCAVDAVMG